MSSSLNIAVYPSIAAISAAAWDMCARGAAESLTELATDPESKSQDAEAIYQVDPDNPFITHDFLWSLEKSGAVGAGSGWMPQHLVVEGEGGDVLAVMPCYLKAHSLGEYVFDHGWAEAYAQAGGRYYPKLQVAVPFTPVAGPRLLVRPGPQAKAVRQALIQGALELCRRSRASSVHLTFPSEREWRYLTALGLLGRTDCQFHWFNAGYRSFADFSGSLTARKRKQVNRERREALADGVEIVQLTGTDLTEAVWDAFFVFYMDTGSRKWGRPYLNREFFSLMGERMGTRIVLMLARRDGRYIAGALNFLGAHTIYGRYWGGIEERPFLHFELCYYQAIEWAIVHGFKRVEAGAQGPHKLARGYRPVTTYSAHYIADPGLRRAVADYLKRERMHVAAETEELAAAMPFRKDAGTEGDE